MTGLLAEGFSLGLATGVYCLGACGPILAPYLLAEGAEGAAAHGRMLAEFLAGRLAAYLAFAVAVSLWGARHPSAGSGPLAAAGLLVSGLLMLVYAVVKNAPRLSFCAPLARSRALRRLPAALGFLVGINVCPPFAAGLVRLLSLSGPLAAAAYFAAFFAGTTIYMLPFMACAPLARWQRLRTIAALASGLSGLWFAGLGLARLSLLWG